MMDAGALPSHHDEKIDIRVTSLLAAGDGTVHADRQEVPSLSTSEIRCNRLGECETTGDGHRLVQPLTGLSGFSTSSSKLMIRITDHVPHRIEVLAAFVNAVLLAVIASSLAFAVYGRVAHPQAVQGETMFAVGLAGLAANLTIVSLLGRSARKNINIRGAFVHAYGDTLGSVGVVAGAALIAFTRFVFVDTLIAVFIVVLIAASTARRLRDSARMNRP